MDFFGMGEKGSMKIDFNAMQETVMPEFKGGKGSLRAKMHVDELGKIMYGSLEPDSSIGLHTHETSSEIIYILSGSGKVLYDDTEEQLGAGDCHYCPKGHAHSLINDGEKELVFFAVIPEQG